MDEPSKLSFFPFLDTVIFLDVPLSGVAKHGFRHVLMCTMQSRRRPQQQIKIFYCLQCLSTFTEERTIWNKLTINQGASAATHQEIENNNAVTSRVLPGFPLMGVTMAINLFIFRFRLNETLHFPRCLNS